MSVLPVIFIVSHRSELRKIWGKCGKNKLTVECVLRFSTVIFIISLVSEWRQWIDR